MVSGEKDRAATAGNSAERGFVEMPAPTAQPYPRRWAQVGRDWHEVRFATDVPV
jgi:hypothetical protein